VTKTILFVFDNDSQKFGEIKLLDTLADAERLLESLLDAGCHEERIRAFTGDEVPMRLSFRAVVSLGQQLSSQSDPVGVTSDGEDSGPLAVSEDAVPTTGLSSMFRPDYLESDKA